MPTAFSWRYSWTDSDAVRLQSGWRITRRCRFGKEGGQACRQRPRQSAFAKVTAESSDTLSPSGGEGRGEGVRWSMESPFRFSACIGILNRGGRCVGCDSVLDCGSPLPLLRPYPIEKRQGTGAVQNLAVLWSVHGKPPFVFPHALEP